MRITLLLVLLGVSLVQPACGVDEAPAPGVRVEAPDEVAASEAATSEAEPSGVQALYAIGTTIGSPSGPCSAVLCAAGTHCEAQPVSCIRAPCPPSAAVCIPNVIQACSNVRCASGHGCQLYTPTCVRAPCEAPRPMCVPTACAALHCNSGTYCAQPLCIRAPCDALYCRPF